MSMRPAITETSNGDVNIIWTPADTIMFPEILDDPISFDLYDYEDYYGIHQQILAEDMGYDTI